MLFKFGKRGTGGFMNSAITFLILNLFITTLFLGFLVRAGSGDSVYEQKYAKQISLIIDNSLPNTTFIFDAEDIAVFAKKNKLNPAEIINFNDGFVTVKLSSGKGYSFPYFSDYEIERAIQLDSSGQVDKIIINIKERVNE